MPSPDVLQVWLGSKIRIPVTFTVDGEAQDPTELEIDLYGLKGGRLHYELGTDPEIVDDDDLGVFHALVEPTHAGRWYWRWTSDLGSDEGTFEVETRFG